MPTLGTPVANAAMEAMTSHAALPTARKVTPATLGDSFRRSTARVRDAQKKLQAGQGTGDGRRGGGGDA